MWARKEVLKKKVPNEKDVLLETDNLEASLRRAGSETLNASSVKFSTANDAKIDFPSGFDVNVSAVVDVVVNIFFKYILMAFA